MSEPKSNRKIDLTGAQIVASVLATLTAAIASSYLGSAPALFVAAAVSIISTAGNAIYRYYLTRTTEKLRAAAPVVLRRANVRDAAGAGPDPGASAHPAAQDRNATGPTSGQGRAWWEGGPDAAKEGIPALSQGSGGHEGRPQAASGRQRPRWLMLGGVAAAVFATVIAGIIVAQSVTGATLCSLFHRSCTTPSVSHLFGDNNTRSTPTPSATQSATPSATPSATQPATPSASPSTASPLPSGTSIGGQQGATPTPSASATAGPSAIPSSAPPSTQLSHATPTR